MILKTVYLHRKDKINPGDWFSSPRHYHPENPKSIEIFDIDMHMPRIIKCEKFIVGGGGLISSKRWVDNIYDWVKKVDSPKKVLWGVGVDEEYFDHPLFKEFDLISVRQTNTPYNYVPCVSCLHELFDLKTPPNVKSMGKGDTIIIGGGKATKRKIPNQNITNMMPMNAIINQIRIHKKIITASYHVWYWSKLLKKDVKIDYETDFRKPLKEKFFTLPNIISLEHCRRLNYEFACKVWL